MHLGDADPDGTRCWITAFGVHPTAMLKEVGTPLLATLENRFRALGKRECRISGYPPGYFTPGIANQRSAPLLDFFVSHKYEAFHEALSMDAPIALFTVPEKIVQMEQTLLAGGIEIRPYRRTDLARFLGFLWRHIPTAW